MICDCDMFDENPDEEDDGVSFCECGHADDEHDDDGVCQAET